MATKPAKKAAAPASRAPAKTTPKKAAPKKAAPKKPASKTAAKTAAKAPAKAAAKAPVKALAKPPAKAPAKAPGKAAAKSTKGGAEARKASHLPHMDDRILNQIIKKLEEMREESRGVVNAHVQADLKQREDGSDVGDDMDQASNERDREFSLIIHQRHLKRLQQIGEAFDRIENETYGLCEGTEEPINPKRLLIMPLARFSLEYQQQQEKMHGRSPDEGPDAYDDSMIGDE